MVAAGGEDGAEPYTVDWHKQPRRPFKRGFIQYGLGVEDGADEALKRRDVLGLDIVEDPAGEDATPAPLQSFEEVGVLPVWLLRELRAVEPTPLQAQMLPIVLAGQNLVAVARADAGQAAAVVVHSAVHIEDQPALTEGDPGPVVLVLVPTQELAGKFAEEAAALLRHSHGSTCHPGGLRCVNVSGGGARSEKLRELGSAGAHIVVGTPKRVHDMACKEQISLLRVTLLIVDGADRMLDLGFASEVNELASWVRPERQTGVLAGTWPKSMAELSSALCFAGGVPVHFSASTVVAPVSVASAAKKAAVGGAKPALGGTTKVIAGKAPGKRMAAPTQSAAKAPKTMPARVKAAELDAEVFPDDW
mmetsp:Transcript_137467/g.342926  ORF Transcript_137467/g.342926 Transcript_137467/m.342926 type:complete len:362 (-) Transcript_137467:108-1193(-)